MGAGVAFPPTLWEPEEPGLAVQWSRAQTLDLASLGSNPTLPSLLLSWARASVLSTVGWVEGTVPTAGCLSGSQPSGNDNLTRSHCVCVPEQALGGLGVQFGNLAVTQATQQRESGLWRPVQPVG